METLSRANLLKGLEYCIFLDIARSSILNVPRKCPNLSTVINNYSSDTEAQSYYILLSPEDENAAFACIFHKILQDSSGNNKLSIVISCLGIDINQFMIPNSISLAIDFSSEYKIDSFVAKNLKRFAVDLHRYIRYLCLYRQMPVELAVCGTSYGGALGQVIGLLYAHLIAYHKDNRTAQFTTLICERLYQTELFYYVVTEINAALSVGDDASPVSQFSTLVLQDIYSKGNNPVNPVHVQESIIAIDRVLFARISLKEIYTFSSQAIFIEELGNYYNNFREEGNVPPLYDRTFNFAFINDHLAGMFSSTTLSGLMGSVFCLFKHRYEVGQVIVMQDSVFQSKHSIGEYAEFMVNAYNNNVVFNIYTSKTRPFNPLQMHLMLFDLPRSSSINEPLHISNSIVSYLSYITWFFTSTYINVYPLYAIFYILKYKTVANMKFLWWTISGSNLF